MLSPKIRAKRVRVIKDKMCIFIIRETFVLSNICLKCQHTQIKAFLCFELKGGWKREGDCDHKTAFIWVFWHFWHMLDKTKVSCLVKTHFLSFITPPFFARFWEMRSLTPLKCAKRGGSMKDKMCVFTIWETFVLSSICQKCQGSK